MRSPRILFVSHTGQISGAEMVLLDIVGQRAAASAFLFEDGPFRTALSARKLDVTVSRWGRGIGAIRRDSSLFEIVPRVGRFCAILFEMRGVARNSDLLYANSQKAFVLSALLTLLVRRPLVWHLHDIISAEHFGSLQRRLQVTLANLAATKVVVPSQAVAAAFIAEGGRRDLVEVVPNGLDIEPEAATPAELRDQLGLPKGKLIGVFSRLAFWKGQHVVLGALAETPGVECIFAGDALFGEQPYAESLVRMVEQLDLEDRVRFLGQRADVPRLMRAVDIVVHPSIDPEPFGRTLVEAMLTGVPVIGTDAGAASEILEAGKAGTLVPARNSGALASAIRRTLAAPDGLKEQLAHAAQRARALYSRARMVDAIDRVIGSVASGAQA